MAKNNTELEKKTRRAQICITIIMFLCLIAQVITLYFYMENIFYVFLYLFGYIFGVLGGFVIGSKVIE